MLESYDVRSDSEICDEVAPKKHCEPDRNPRLPLDLPQRVSIVRSGGKSYRHTFRRITPADWDGFFSRIDAEVEQEGARTTRVISAEAATLWLYSIAISHAQGYRVSNGLPLEELAAWKERIPQHHRLRAAELLMKVSVEGREDDVLDAEGEKVELKATWSATSACGPDPEGMLEYAGLVHRFTTPTAEHRRRFLRARSRTTVVGGSRTGRTLIPSTQPILAKLYDELIVSVDGYAVDNRPISTAEIPGQMDVFHKVCAVRELFETRVPEEALEATA